MPSFVGRFEWWRCLWTAPYGQSLQVCSICWPSLQLFQNQPCHALPASTLCVLGWPGLSLIRCYTRLQPATLLCVILLRYKGRVSAQTRGGTVTWDPLRPARPPPDSSLNYATRYFWQIFHSLAAPQASAGFWAACESKAQPIVGQNESWHLPLNGKSPNPIPHTAWSSNSAGRSSAPAENLVTAFHLFLFCHIPSSSSSSSSFILSILFLPVLDQMIIFPKAILRFLEVILKLLLSLICYKSVFCYPNFFFRS